MGPHPQRPLLPNGLLKGLAGAVDRHRVAAKSDDRWGDGAADALAGAGDQDALPGERPRVGQFLSPVTGFLFG